MERSLLNTGIDKAHTCVVLLGTGAGENLQAHRERDRPYRGRRRPICDARLAGGERVNIVLEPIARNGAQLTIRKFRRQPFALSELVELGSMTEAAARLLQILVRAKANIVVAGGTSTGKTSLLNTVSREIPHDERLVVAETLRSFSFSTKTS